MSHRAFTTTVRPEDKASKNGAGMCSEDYDAECRTTTTGHSAWYTQCALTESTNFPMSSP